MNRCFIHGPRALFALLFTVFLALSQTLGDEVPAEKPTAAPLQYAHGVIRIPAATFDEAKSEEVSVARAEKYLEDASAAWNGKHQCISLSYQRNLYGGASGAESIAR